MKAVCILLVALAVQLLLQGCAGEVEPAPTCTATKQTHYGTAYRCTEPPAYGTLPGDCEAVRGDPEHEFFCHVDLPSAVSPRCFLDPVEVRCEGTACVGVYVCGEPPEEPFLRPGVACAGERGRYSCSWERPELACETVGRSLCASDGCRATMRCNRNPGPELGLSCEPNEEAFACRW